MPDWLNFFVDLAKALFKAFGTAVADYPFTTLIVFVAVFAILNEKNLFVLYDRTSKKFVFPVGSGEYFYGLIGFIGTVIIANFVGYIFNAVVGFLGFIFGAAKFWASPFSAHPVVFTIIFVVLEGIVFGYFLYRSRSERRNIDLLPLISIMFLALFGTYILTSLYGGIWGEKRENGNAEESKK